MFCSKGSKSNKDNKENTVSQQVKNNAATIHTTCCILPHVTGVWYRYQPGNMCRSKEGTVRHRQSNAKLLNAKMKTIETCSKLLLTTPHSMRSSL